MTIPSVLCLILIALSIWAKPSVSLLLIFVFSSFGALVLVDPSFSAGINLLVASGAAIAFIFATLLKHGEFWRTAKVILDPRKFGLLFIFLCIGIVSAQVLPNVFEGKIYVFPLGHTKGYTRLAPVGPSTQNFTQVFYLTLSFLVAVCTAMNMQVRNFPKALLSAIFYGGVAVIVTGLADMVLSAAGGANIIASFKNASYVLHENDDIAGARRVVGFMPEASVFSFVAGQIGALLLFLRPVYPRSMGGNYVTLMALGCIALTVLSLSSTGITTALVILIVYGADLIFRRALTPEARTRAEAFIALVIMAAVAVVLLSMMPDIANSLGSIFEKLTFGKQYSQSYRERSSWNMAAVSAFLESYGAGVGVGTLRFSNFFNGLLATTGIIGFLFFVLFNARIFLGKTPKQSDVATRLAVKGFKLALIPAFVSLGTSATTTDFGPIIAISYGAIIGFTMPTDVKATLVKYLPARRPLRPAPVENIPFTVEDIPFANVARLDTWKPVGVRVARLNPVDSAGNRTFT